VNVDKPTLDEVFFAITGHGTGTEDDPDSAGTGASEAGSGHETVLEVQ
jgi:hypothetical protein